MSFLLGGGHKIIHPTQGGLLLKKFENHCPKVQKLKGTNTYTTNGDVLFF